MYKILYLPAGEYVNVGELSWSKSIRETASYGIKYQAEAVKNSFIIFYDDVNGPYLPRLKFPSGSSIPNYHLEVVEVEDV